jgi:phage/plasmid-like protein (TIGR03299 family)
MAHNIRTASGRAEMFYVKERPWHGLGTRVEDAPTSAEALALAGLDWTLSLEPMTASGGINVPMGKAVIRTDVNRCIGMVGNRYRVVQNRDAFSMLDSLVTTDELRYETAGALGHGERVWMLARVPGDLRIDGTDDVTHKYLLLSNQHDGFGSLRVFFTGVRVVCQNTLNFASKQAQRQGLVIRHTGSLVDKIEEGRRILGLAHEFFDAAVQQMNRMASLKMTSTTAYKYFESVFPDPADKGSAKVAARNAEEIRGKLVDLFERGAGADIKGVKGTLWTAYNACTEYVDHVVKTKDSTKALGRDEQQGRLASVWFGQGASIKGKAWEAAMAYASQN